MSSNQITLVFKVQIKTDLQRCNYFCSLSTDITINPFPKYYGSGFEQLVDCFYHDSFASQVPIHTKLAKKLIGTGVRTNYKVSFT